ncbi:universal stress protein [Nitrosopumilus sp. S4]
MKRILVPHDQSTASDFAFEKAVDLSAKLQSNLFLLTIIGAQNSTSGMSSNMARVKLDELDTKARSYLEKYEKNQIAIFNSEHVKIIIITNDDGYDYVSPMINPDDQINYIVETDENGNIDIKKSLQSLRTDFNISRMLNDGGRQMSNGMKQLGLLGGERISYEPSPGDNYVPKIITDDMILGRDGMGIDGSAVKDSITVFSQKINTSRKESLNLHLYPMCNS